MLGFFPQGKYVLIGPPFGSVAGSALQGSVTDPQVLFMAIGDATSDLAPLQVGQFESTAAPHSSGGDNAAGQSIRRRSRSVWLP